MRLLFTFEDHEKKSAGILVFRKNGQEREFLLVHFGGPFWKNEQEGAWSIPKGECEKGETLLETALREFKEETGFTAQGDLIPLSPITQRGGKIVHAWALAMDIDPEKVISNIVRLTLPSGKQIQFPEIDKAAWYTRTSARKLIIGSQFAFIQELENILQDS
ncbi:MAG TPA: NUDIX domain-containing protein [Puia sp.]|nr:NUDIX domain-containing protein [Puia sp.]